MTDRTTKRFSVLTGLKLAASLALGFALLYGVFYLVAPYHHDRQIDRLMRQTRQDPTPPNVARLKEAYESGRGTEAGRRRIREFMVTRMPALVARQKLTERIDDIRRGWKAAKGPHAIIYLQVCRDILPPLRMLSPDDPLRLEGTQLIGRMQDEFATQTLAAFSSWHDPKLVYAMERYLTWEGISPTVADDVRKALYPYLRQRVHQAMRDDRNPEFLHRYVDHPAVTGPMKEQLTARLKAQDTAILRQHLAGHPVATGPNYFSSIEAMDILCRGLVDKALGDKVLQSWTVRFDRTRAVAGYAAGAILWVGCRGPRFAPPIHRTDVTRLTVGIEQRLGDRWAALPDPTAHPDGLFVRSIAVRPTPGPDEVTLRLHLVVVRQPAAGTSQVLYEATFMRRLPLEVQPKDKVENLSILPAFPQPHVLSVSEVPHVHVLANGLAGTWVVVHEKEHVRHVALRIRELPGLALGHSDDYQSGNTTPTTQLLTALTPGAHTLTLEAETDWELVYSHPGITSVHPVSEAVPFTITVAKDSDD